MKNIIVILCVILHSSGILGQLEFLKKFLDNNDVNITRVRTTAERYSHWRHFAVLDFIGLVERFDGYTAEEHKVQTVDGYILKLHRISGSPYSPKAYGKPPILIGHGLGVSSDMQVVLGPQQALAFMLADAGYDVWFCNFRGNSYSNRHVKYPSSGDNHNFWYFSMDEMSLIDLPLFIDTVLEKTDKKKLVYIGFSMGSTVSYILLSSKPEYNDKMNLVLNMAPVGIFSRPLSPLLTLFEAIEPSIMSLALANRMYRILPQSKLNQIVGKDICGTKEGKATCDFVLRVTGRNDQANSIDYSTIFAYIPSGTSVFTVNHYYQMINSGKFRFYDHGAVLNRAKYNTTLPPEYDLSQITSPQGIFYTDRDIYANLRDTKTLKNKLSNVVAFEKAPKNYNHLDFAMHSNAKNDVYCRMLEIIAQYSFRKTPVLVRKRVKNSCKK